MTIDVLNMTGPPPTPYVLAALRYRSQGWSGVLPIGFDRETGFAPRRKKDPPKGYTGRNGADPSDDQIDAWCERYPYANVGLRLPDGVVGIDVDDYDDKPGAATLAAVEAEVGIPLPATWRSSSKAPPSGIHAYRVPPGLDFVAELGPGIDIIRRTHRYIVCEPSVHPSGATYRWYRPGGDVADGPPRIDDLAWLPAAWIARLRDLRPKAPQASNPPARVHREPTRSNAVARTLDKALAALGSGSSRHDAACAGAAGLARLEMQGHHGSTAALDELGDRFCAAVTGAAAGKSQRTPDGAAREWADLLTSARTLVRTTASERPTWDELQASGRAIARDRRGRRTLSPGPELIGTAAWDPLGSADLMAPICPNRTPHPGSAHRRNCDDFSAAALLGDVNEGDVRRTEAHLDRLGRQLDEGECGTTPRARPPDLDMWMEAIMKDPKIALAATRRLGLQSPREHDLSLATRLRQLDWSPQQIADLLSWNRKRRAEDLNHPGYYTRTVDKAVQTVAQRKGGTR